MTILLTGIAGFIGYHLAEALLKEGHTVTGIDNLNDYYDPALKLARLNELGITGKPTYGEPVSGSKNPALQFVQLDLNDAAGLDKVFQAQRFDIVCNLAAQTGVRYSITNPQAYVDSNITGFFHLINISNKYEVSLFLYASSSSVYGNSREVPFRTDSDTDKPVSFYAASKKSNELMAHTYSYVFGLKTIGVRFFTVYGPWGRPDMAYFSFTDKILHNQPIQLFNHGRLQRDFTYVDDIVSGMMKIIATKGSNSPEKYKLYNIGNHDAVTLDRFVKAIEAATHVKANLQYLPMQPGDVEVTYADIQDLQRDYGFAPTTPIEEGIKRFVDWYARYYGIRLK